MSGLGRKILYVLLPIDALVALYILFATGGGIQILTGWLVLNALIIFAILAIRARLSRSRKHRPRFSAKTYKNRQSSQARNFAAQHMTQNGELVKSGGERMIADYLCRNDIRYEYERPVKAAFSNRRISRPDFYLPDYDVYIEYWGMVNSEDDGTRQEYIKGMEWKMTKYRENHIKFISIYPEDLKSLDSILRKRLDEATK